MLFVLFFVGNLFCANIYIDLTGNTNSDCGSTPSYACSTFAAAYLRVSGSFVFLSNFKII
jgi:hypothetical protein